MKENWAIIMLIVVVTVAVFILGVGAYTFQPQRARNVKYAEVYQQSVLESVVRIRQSHPEIVRTIRLDRFWWYLGMHGAMLCYAVAITLGAPLTSNILSLGDAARYTMAVCFMVGALLVLIGAALGAKVGSWVISSSTREHLTSEVLGDDIALPYRVGMAGQGAVSVSLGIYAWTSFQSTMGSLGGWLAAFGAVVSVLTIVVFARAVATFEKWERLLITEAYAAVRRGEREQCGADDDGH